MVGIGGIGEDRHVAQVSVPFYNSPGGGPESVLQES